MHVCYHLYGHDPSHHTSELMSARFKVLRNPLPKTPDPLQFSQYAQRIAPIFKMENHHHWGDQCKGVDDHCL